MMDAMTAKVVEFVLSRQRMAAELATLAEGNEFQYGDNELSELVVQLVSDDPRGLGAWTLSRWGVKQTDARSVGMELELMAQDPPYWVDHVDWETVRNKLIENKEAQA